MGRIEKQSQERTERGERLRAAWASLLERDASWTSKALARHLAHELGGSAESYWRSVVRWLGPQSRGVDSRCEAAVALVEALAFGGDPGWVERQRRVAIYAARVEAGLLPFEHGRVEDWDAEITPQQPEEARPRVAGPVSLFAPFGAGHVLVAS